MFHFNSYISKIILDKNPNHNLIDGYKNKRKTVK